MKLRALLFGLSAFSFAACGPEGGGPAGGGSGQSGGGFAFPTGGGAAQTGGGTGLTGGGSATGGGTGVVITGVSVLNNGVGLPGNQVPPGLATVTVQVTGVGLSMVSTISLANQQSFISNIEPSALPGGSDTSRAWDFINPNGMAPAGELVNVALWCRGSDGGVLAMQTEAFKFSPLAVNTVDGGDTGFGSLSSPVRSMDRAFALARSGDVVVLQTNSAPADGVAPAGVSVMGDALSNPVITCASGTSDVGLHSVNGGASISNLRFKDCDAGVLIDDDSNGALSIKHCAFENIPTPLATTVAGNLEIAGSTFTVPTGSVSRVTLNGGIATLSDNVFTNVTLKTNNTVLRLTGGAIATEGTSLSIGPAPAPSRIENLTVASNADAVYLAPDASVTLSGVGLRYSQRALVIDGASATLAVSNVHENVRGIVLTGASPSFFTAADAGISYVWTNSGEGLTVSPSGGTATVAATLGFTGNGMSVQNPTGVTTNLSGNLAFTDPTGFGLRIEGGTTNLAAGSTITGNARAAGDAVLWLKSGGGTIHVTNGAFSVPAGSGVLIENASQHTVELGDAGNLTFDLTGHANDFHFGVEDHRASATTQIRADFIGTDGGARGWSGTYTNTNSYSGATNPKDNAAWAAFNNSTFDFGP